MKEMTERERRARGLPPTEAQIALAESMRAKLEKEMAPVLAQVTEAGRRAAEVIRPTIETVQDMLKNERMTRELVVPAVQRRVRLDEDQFNLLVKRTPEHVAPSKTEELSYDRKLGEFSRITSVGVVRSAFADAKDNKRRRLIEKLLGTRAYIGTKTFASYLTCSEKQIGNLVSAVNNKLMVDLALTTRVIDSKRGSGYRIHPAYAIIQKR